MKPINIIFILFLFIFIISGCSRMRDEILNPSTGCTASDCHIATQLQSYYPTETKLHRSHVNALEAEYPDTCSLCHYSYDDISLHKNSFIDGSSNGKVIVYFDTTVNQNGIWDMSSKTCDNLTCHGDIAWDPNLPSTCVALCHQSGNIYPESAPDPTANGSHSAHITDTGITCVDCHYGYNENTTHNDGNLDNLTLNSDMVLFNPSFDTGGSYIPSSDECSNTYCHGNFAGGNSATVSWNGSSVACGSCHDLAPANVNFGSHDKHTDSDKYKYDCSLCHNGIASGDESGTPVLTGSSLHINFKPDVVFGGLASQYTGLSPGYNTNTLECSNTYCHGAFGNGGIHWLEGNSSNMPAWGGTAPCGSCHGQGANAALGIPTTVDIWNAGDESHSKHAGYYAQGGYQYPCGFCHNGVYDATLSTGNGTGGAYKSGTKTPDYNSHADGNRTPLSFYTAFTASGSATVNGLQDVTCSGLYCHSDGWDTSSTSADTGGISSPIWGGASKSAIVCDSCHQNGPGNPAPQHNTGGRDHYNPEDGHKKTCAHCHKYVTTASVEDPSNSSDTILFSNNRHVNRMKNVSFGMDTQSVSGGYSYSRTGGRCYVSCHGESHDPGNGWYSSSFSGSMTYEP